MGHYKIFSLNLEFLIPISSYIPWTSAITMLHGWTGHLFLAESSLESCILLLYASFKIGGKITVTLLAKMG